VASVDPSSEAGDVIGHMNKYPAVTAITRRNFIDTLFHT
jgi:hypothetical protein